MEIQEYNKSVKVSCDFCGAQMECPEEMLKNTKKHMCAACFRKGNPTDEELKDVHVDLPAEEMDEMAASGTAEKLASDFFPEFWSEQKEGLKDHSKKDLAEEMFEAGAYYGIRAFLESVKQIEEKEKK
ncbi:hypothetical protein J4419_01145 [Candidatus Woesearchaeota archaeon]|nr:hypothetical protein [Candidatus Woesearchaeota archaeon]